MKALVTGGAGFIGSHLTEMLLEGEHEVTVLDHLSEVKLRNIQHLKNRTNLHAINGDLGDRELLQELSKRCDTVFHLAHTDIRKSSNYRQTGVCDGLLGTINVLDAVAKNNVADLVMTSTSAVYGDTSVKPTPESYFGSPISLYGASKMACEAYADAYSEMFPMRFWAFRLANVIGERCRRGVIWDFVNKLLENPRELEILGDGKQSRGYIHVEDCVEGILTGYAKAREKINIFNLTVEENFNVIEIAALIMEEMDLKNVKLKCSGEKSGWVSDIPVVALSIEKIRRLGWKPKITSTEAIKRTIKWTLDEAKSKETVGRLHHEEL